MSDFTLRPPKIGDGADVAALFNQPRVTAGTLQIPFASEDGLDDWLTKSNINTRFVIADVGGRAVGFIRLNRQGGRMSHIGELFISVHDDHQGKGIGQALMKAAIDIADNWMGLIRLQLEVLVDNVDAIRLYETHGFKREGRARAGTLRDGELVDHYYMARLVPAPARRGEDAEENP